MKRLFVVSTVMLMCLCVFQSSTTQGQSVFNFESIGSYALPPSPFTIVTADFDGDRTLDLAVASLGAVESISILLGNGDGTFQEPMSFNGGNGPMVLATGDFNGDGKTDLVGSALRWDLMVYLGNGDGTFQPARLIRDVADVTKEIIVRDFNNDGEDDLAVGFNAGYGQENAWLQVFLGNGDGTFQSPLRKSLGRRMRAMTVGDFNGDAKDDLAWSSWVSSDVVTLIGSGNGTFQTGQAVWIGGSGRVLVSTDLNNDGHADLAAVVADSIGYVAPLLNQGNGSLYFAPNSFTGGAPSVLATGDFDRDGKADLVMDTEKNNTDTANFLRGDGTGSFSPVLTQPAGGSPWRFAVADLNADGTSDLAVANYYQGTVTILLNRAQAKPPRLIRKGSRLRATESRAETLMASTTTTSPNQPLNVIPLLGGLPGVNEPGDLHGLISQLSLKKMIGERISDRSIKVESVRLSDEPQFERFDSSSISFKVVAVFLERMNGVAEQKVERIFQVSLVRNTAGTWEVHSLRPN